MDTEERHQVLNEILEHIQSVSSDDREATWASIVAYLDSRPEFAEAGVSPDGIVWGIFTDGGLYFHADNQRPHLDSRSADASSAPPGLQVNRTVPAQGIPAVFQVGGGSGAELPGSTKATLLEAYGPLGDDMTENVAKWLSEAGYEATRLEGTIERMMKVSGDGVFVFNGHGGNPLLGNPALPDTYAILSTTEVTDDLDKTYRADLQHGRLGWGSISWDYNPAFAPDGDCEVEAGVALPPKCQRYTHKWVYALTTAGVQQYWRFADNALVALGACSGSALSQTVLNLPGGRVGAFAGFDRVVAIAGADEVLEFFFDRLLGRNELPPDEKPDLRPFDAGTVGVYMDKKGKSTDPYDLPDYKERAVLDVEDRGPTVLVPSIGTMEVHEESNELFIEGMFGSESDTIQMCPNANANASACQSLPTGSWGTGMVVGKVEDEGPKSAGWVRVVVDGRMSNLVPLTEWRGQINYQASADALAPNLLNKLSLTVHLRADVHLARERPWDNPASRTIEIEAVGDSWGSWSASGSSSQGGGTFTLKGSGDMPVGEDQPDHEGAHFLFIGTLVVTDIGDPPELVDVNIHAHLSSDSEAKLTISAEGLNQTTGFPLLLTDVLFGRDFELDAEYAIRDGEVEASGGVGGAPSMGPAKLSWKKMDARHAPDVNHPPAA
ncbi:MAG: hypothetical protein OEY55_09895 [Acidimicrobiia bacterium]|nr:hypothetical protein [Acidimicrobiia bacterium]